MKHILSVFFVLAVVFGFTRQSQAVHVQVLDPPNVCMTTPGQSGPFNCAIVDSTQPFNVAFDSSTCGLFGLPTGATDGCLIVFNNTFNTFTGLDLTFTGTGDLSFDCSTTDPNSVFASCSQPEADSLDFSGAPGLAGGHTMVIFEDGADPTLVHGTGNVTITATPEPDSILLMVTGTMMAGLYMSRKQLTAAFGRAK
jgi:hypothetical protein